VLRGSYRSVVALDDAQDRAAGFVTMISDGVLTAFIPWLEVLPAYQGKGIGSELMRRVLDGTDRFYSVDLVCPVHDRVSGDGGHSAGALPCGPRSARPGSGRAAAGCRRIRPVNNR